MCHQVRCFIGWRSLEEFKYFGCISYLFIHIWIMSDSLHDIWLRPSCDCSPTSASPHPPLPLPSAEYTLLPTTHTHTHTHTSSPTGCPLFTYRLVHCTIQGTGTCPAHPLSLSRSSSSFVVLSAWLLHILSSPPSSSILRLSPPLLSATMTSTVSGKTTCSTPARRSVEILWICMCVCQGKGRGCIILSLFNNAEGLCVCVIVMATGFSSLIVRGLCCR